MSLSLCNSFLPLNHREVIFRSPLPYTPLHHHLSLKPSAHTNVKALSKAAESTSSSLTSIITKLETQDQSQLNQQQEDPRLADMWREIHGKNDWAGLLDPMDPLLRTELIRYGEMAQACYDAFDFDPFSKYCGSCRFVRRRFFDSLNMSHHGYDVTRYLYATSNINLPNFFKQSRCQQNMWSSKASWIGYVAVSNDETTELLGRRDITVAWRGTVTRLEWITDLMDYLKPINDNKSRLSQNDHNQSLSKIPCPDPAVKVESGFLDLYMEKDVDCRFCKYSAREQILTEVKRLMELYPNEEISITITGHSLGSALAMLSAYDIAETRLNKREDGSKTTVTVLSFSGPRVGNMKFKERVEELGVKVLRVVNVHDVVPKSPGFFLNEQLPAMVMQMAKDLPWCYYHFGVELELDHTNSPFLKQTADPVCTHNLEALLHLLDGYRGKGQRFVLANGRDPALVNKGADFLKDHYLVPPFWRQDENKGMVRNHDGRWMQPERPKLDEHPEDMHHHLLQLGLSTQH